MIADSICNLKIEDVDVTISEFPMTFPISHVGKFMAVITSATCRKKQAPVQYRLLPTPTKPSRLFANIDYAIRISKRVGFYV
jgi:hypothetical protein